MKKLFFPLMLIAFLVAYYNLQSEKPNVVITAVAAALFFYGVMKFSAKVPGKNQEEDE